MPFVAARRVSSPARSTFLPGRYLVPLCRIIILPDSALWPSAILTPNLCACESRPNLVEPPALTCAIYQNITTMLIFRQAYWSCGVHRTYRIYPVLLDLLFLSTKKPSAPRLVLKDLRIAWLWVTCGYLRVRPASPFTDYFSTRTWGT